LSESTEFKPRKFDFRSRNHAITPVALSPAIRDKVRSAIAHLDRVAIETPLSDELRSRARIILDLRGRPADVFCQFGPRHAPD